MTPTRQLDCLRAVLEDLAARDATITYGELARVLELEPPHVIGQTAKLLERSMREDAAVGHPFLAALVCSRETGMPRRGFFELAASLGRFQGDPGAGDAAMSFFRNERERLRAVWRPR